MVLNFKFVTDIVAFIDERYIIALSVFYCLIRVCDNEERTFIITVRRTSMGWGEQKKVFLLST